MFGKLKKEEKGTYFISRTSEQRSRSILFLAGNYGVRLLYHYLFFYFFFLLYFWCQLLPFCPFLVLIIYIFTIMFGLAQHSFFFGFWFPRNTLMPDTTKGGSGGKLGAGDSREGKRARAKLRRLGSVGVWVFWKGAFRCFIESKKKTKKLELSN